MAPQPALHLTHPTKAEVHDQLASNSTEWRGALSTEAYFRREALLADQDLTRAGGLQSWILATTPDESSTDRRALCSCETIAKRALVALAGQVDVKEVRAYGVASVFCPAENRGKGYAGEMIRLLGEWMDREGQAALSVLYSDIGKSFYAKHGWRPMESAHVRLTPASEVKVQGLPEVKLLQESDVEALCLQDEAMVRRRLANLAGSGKDALAIVPDLKTLRWQQARESFVSNELYGRTPEYQGALTTSPSGTRVWCLWTRWWYNTDPNKAKGNSMHILRLIVEQADYDDTAATDDGVSKAKGSNIAKAIAAVLAAAQVEASKWNIEEVQIWNPSSYTLAAAQQLEPDARVVHRETDSITSLRLCDPELAGKANSLVWTCNEKYAWC